MAKEVTGHAEGVVQPVARRGLPRNHGPTVVATPMAFGVVGHEPFGVELGVVQRFGEAAHLVGRGGHERLARSLLATACFVGFLARGQGIRLRIGCARGRARRVGLRIRHARVGLCRVGLRMGRFFARSQGIRLPFLRARPPVLHFSARVGVAFVRVRCARVGLCRVGLRVGGFFACGQGVRLRMIRARFLILRARFSVRHARRPVLHFSARVGVAFVRVRRVGIRVGGFFACNQGVRLRMIRAHLPFLRARPPVRYARRPVCRVGARVRGECLRVGRFFARGQRIRL